jgi:hypothetical protein
MNTQPFLLGSEHLQFRSGAECRRWLESLPLTNVAVAHAVVARQVSLIAQARLAPIELLTILETLREPVDYLQSELARKYTGRALPLDASEAAAWDKVFALWNEIGEAYASCREAHVRGDAALRNLGALILMRCLNCCAHAMFEYYRVYREVPAAAWRTLHELYAQAESAGVAHVGVSDVYAGKDRQSSCSAAYCQALLAQLANPFSLSGRQMEFLARWLDKWAGLASVSAKPLPPSPMPPLVVDLSGDRGPQFAEALAASADVRYLDVDTLGRTLRQVMALLKQGQTPGQLGLGEDARQPGCESLLMLLYVQWCRAGMSRSEARSDTEEKAQVCLGMHAAHFHISGRAFRPPGSTLTRGEEQDMQLFGHVSERTESMLASQESGAVESWQLVNHSASGFLCMMREPDAGMRISHNQVIAVRRGTSKLFQLGVVQWLRLGENGELLVGTRLLPGIPRAVAVRSANFMPAGNPAFERGLLLPEMTAPPAPATLMVPSGWYQSGRFVELYSDGKRVAKLVSLLEKGSDFDRCAVSVS